MPLQSGKGKSAIKANVRELLHSYKASGKIGSSHPKSMKKAARQAVAIAYRKSREG